jgi:hypothetical protein
MKNRTLLLVSAFALTGCLDDDPVSDSEVMDLVYCTNQADSSCNNDYTLGSWRTLSDDKCSGTYCFSDGSDAPQSLALTRWREGQLIPVYYLGKDDHRFTQAMERAEAIAGYRLFDFQGVINLDISDPENIDYSELNTDWGFIWSQGTSIGNMVGGCSGGTVSTRPFHYNTTSYLVDIDYAIENMAKKYNTDHQFNWLNIDSVNGANGGQITCNKTAEYDVVLHELGHALGMHNHFSGFGDGNAWGQNAERVLRTMYNRNNPPGQPFEALYVPK